MTGQVHLVGAGCGGPELLTVAGRELLRRCDVVVYDDLIDPALLDLAPAGAERIRVGKRAGIPSPDQDGIDALLIERARAGQTVVRLKGGDPFVFGRGGEEALALSAAGIPYTVVPGVSSAFAVPMEAGIPVTHRGAARSVHVVTAHTRDGDLPEHLTELAALDGTLVFLMGLRSLGRLAAALMEAGKDPDTPAAVLSGGCSPHPAEVRGTLADIAARTEAEGVLPPAVIVIGPTASMDLRSPIPVPAVTVGLTGTDAFQDRLRPLIEGHGWRHQRIQRARCRPLGGTIPWDDLRDGGWAVFTSRTGVEIFSRRLFEEGRDVRDLARCRFAVIGRATGEALARHGIRADLYPETYTGEALARDLSSSVGGGETVFLFDSAQGSGVVQDTLSLHGVPCRRISLYDMGYETVGRGPAPQYILFGSAGAVAALARDGWTLPEETVPVCVGPVCAEAVRRLYGRTPLTADEIGAEAMVRAVAEHIGRAPG